MFDPVIDDVASTSSNISTIAKMLLEPRYIKKHSKSIIDSVTDAQAYVNNNPNPCYIITDNYFVINTAGKNLLERYGCPNSVLGIRQYKNILNVLIQGSINPTIDDSNIDWISLAIEEIKYVSDDALSKAWFKLIQNEAECKMKYSKRTLKRMSELSQKEALLFEQYAKYVVDYGGNLYLPIYNAKDKTILDLHELANADLINNEALTATNGSLIKGEYFINFEGELTFYKLTEFGKDLIEVIEHKGSIDDVIDCVNKQKCVWKAYHFLENGKTGTVYKESQKE